MYETIEEVYRLYLKQCYEHIAWLKSCKSTIYKRVLFNFGDNRQKYNIAWINTLVIVETVLGLTEEEKQSHNLKDYE